MLQLTPITELPVELSAAMSQAWSEIDPDIDYADFAEAYTDDVYYYAQGPSLKIYVINWDDGSPTGHTEVWAEVSDTNASETEFTRLYPRTR